jgi:hypothetical protein
VKKLSLVLCFVVFSFYPLVAQDASASRPPSVTEVMNFFDVMGMRAQMQSMLESERKQLKVSFNDMFRKTLPAASAKERDQFLSIMDEAMNDPFKDYPMEDILRDMISVGPNRNGSFLFISGRSEGAQGNASHD